MENTQELLKIIEQLKKENKALKEDKANIEVELYETNKRLNEALSTISSLQEKEKIERTRTFIPKGEKLNDIVINEAEEIIKEEKLERKTNKGKKYNKNKFDYEKYVTEIRIIEPDEKVCPKCGSTLIEASSKVRYITFLFSHSYFSSAWALIMEFKDKSVIKKNTKKILKFLKFMSSPSYIII